jgi:hypothetical protein
MTAALPAIIPNPDTPVISAMIKNKIALRIIVKGLINLRYMQKIMPGEICLKFFCKRKKSGIFFIT